MSQKDYFIGLFIVRIIILHVLDTYALYLPNGTNTDSVRLTTFGNSDQDNAYPFETTSQQLISATFPAPVKPLISTTFPVPVNTDTIVDEPASSSVLPSGVTPNAFTKAVLALPILQDFLDVKINRYQAGDNVYHMELSFLGSVGHPDPPTVANNEALIIARLNFLTIPLFIHFKGNTLEKYLSSQAIEVVPLLVQNFANGIEHSLKSSLMNSSAELMRAIEEGYINFIQSLGFSFRDTAYVLSLIFNEEVNAYTN